MIRSSPPRRLGYFPAACTCWWFTLAAAGTAAPPEARLEATHREFLARHCTACHGDKEQQGEVRLDEIAFAVDTVATADLWQKVLNQLNSGEMPPEDAPQPEAAAKAEFLDDLSRTLATARKVLADVQGTITMRRLNRREYRNTIRELLGVDVRVNELPADSGAGTFDTVGSSLFMSSDQFEQYLALGRQALDEHFARFVAPAAVQPRRIHVEVEEKNARIAKALEERIDARRRYEQWTAAVEAAAAKPENAAVVPKIREEKPNDATHPHEQWRRIAGAPGPEAFGFVDAVHAEQQGRRNWEHYVPHHRAYVDHPLNKTGAFLTVEDTHVNPYQAFRIPGDWPAGDYVVRVRVAATGDTPASRHFVEFGSQHDTGVRAVLSSHEVTGTIEKPQVIEIPLKFTPTGGRGFFFQERGSSESDTAAREVFEEAKRRNGVGSEFALWIDWIEIEGLMVGQQAGSTANPTQPLKLRKDPETWANKYMPIYAEGYVEKFGRYQKWCAAVEAAAAKPENAEAVEKLRADPRLKTQSHLFYNGFAGVAGAPPPTEFGFKDVDDAQFARSEFNYHHRYYVDYQKLPNRETGAWLMLYSLGRHAGIAAPEKWPAGQYTLRIRLAAADESPKERRFIEIGTGKADKADFNVLSSHQVVGTLASPQVLEIPVEVNASGDRTFTIRDKRPNTRDAEYAMFREAWDKTSTGPRPCIWIDWVELEGPLASLASAEPAAGGPAARPAILAGAAGIPEREAARAAIEAFAVRAFRDRRPSAEFLERLLAIFDARREAAEPLETAIRSPLSVVLASPGFLYLAEPRSGEQPERLDATELATRLSYFLSSGPPDDLLLAAARSGELLQPAVLAREVDRLIDAPKSDEFVRGFVHQWLDMDRLDFFQFDTRQFRDFDESTKAAARREVYESFAHLLRGKGGLGDLLVSDHVFVNGLLASYYGIDGVSGDEFRRVPVPEGSPRGGLLGMAAILAMGSNGERTSPVERGAWVLRHLLHDPPPPAPKNVPQLDRLAGRPISPRERLAAHQEQPQCANCHRRIDPIGFGLENFDAAGRWREVDVDPKTKQQWPIDPAGSFHDGPSFRTYEELRDVIAGRREDFARGFAEHLVEYALGRPCGFTDEELVAAMVRLAAADEYAVRTFIHSLVASREFQSK